MRNIKRISLALLLAVLMLVQSVAVFAEVSPIVYEVNDDGSVTSYVYARNLTNGAKLYTAVYNADGSFAFATASAQADKAGYLKTTVKKEEGQTVKSFVWDKANTPFYTEGEYGNAIDVNDVAITVNGNDLTSYLAKDTELAFGETYDVDIKDAGFTSIPVVKATSKDSNVECSVDYNSDGTLATVTFFKGDRILSDKAATYKNASGGTFSVERYTKTISKTITIRFVKTWLGQEDLIKGSPNGAIVSASNLGQHQKKTYTLAEGETVKKISLKIASIPYQGGFIVLRPTGNVADKNVLVNSDGSAISWVDDNGVLTGSSIKTFNYDTYKTTEYHKTSKTAVTSNATVAAMKELSYGDNKKQTGGRTLTDRTPIYAMAAYGINGSSTSAVAKSYEGCNYIVFASAAVTNATVEFYVDKDVEVNVFTSAATTISDVEGENATAWNATECKGSDIINRRYQNSTDVVSVAWLMREGKLRAEDVSYQANQNVKYDLNGDGVLSNNENINGIYTEGLLPGIVTGTRKSGYYISRYDAIEYLVKESGSESGFGFDDAKGLKDIPNSILPYYYSETYKYDDILNLWDDTEFSYSADALVTDFQATASLAVEDMPMEVVSGTHKGETATYTGTVSISEAFRPKVTDFFGYTIAPDRNGALLNADGTLNNANGTGALVSYPDGFGLDDATYICFQNGWVNDDGYWFGKDTSSWYANKRANQVDLWNNQGTAYTWASFKVTRAAEVLIFANNPVPYLEEEGSGYDKTILASGDELKVMRILPKNTYNFYIVYSKKYNAGDVVELKTPKMHSTLYCAFVRDVQDSNADATLTSLSVNGKAIENFDPNVTEYTYALTEEEACSATAPVITAITADANAKVTVRKPETFPGSSKIVVNNPAGGTKIYTINYTEDYTYVTDVAMSVEGKKVSFYKNGVVAGADSWLATDRIGGWHITEVNDPALVGNDKIIGGVDGYVSGSKINFTLKRPARIRVLLNNTGTTWDNALKSEGFVLDPDVTTIRVVGMSGTNVRNYMKVFVGEFDAQDMSITFAKPDMPALYAIEYLPFK